MLLLRSFDAAQLHALVLVFLVAHSYGYAIGLVFFGVHCLVLGYAVLKSGLVPRLLGVLLGIASVAYVTDSFARTLLSSYDDYERVFAPVVFAPAFIAELSFCLWLLVRGVDIGGAQKRQDKEPS